MRNPKAKQSKIKATPGKYLKSRIKLKIANSVRKNALAEIFMVVTE
jgi:hypothetical protein